MFIASVLGYVLFEVPSQLVLKKLNPKIWLPFLAFAYGIGKRDPF